MGGIQVGMSFSKTTCFSHIITKQFGEPKAENLLPWPPRIKQAGQNPACLGLTIFWLVGFPCPLQIERQQLS